MARDGFGIPAIRATRKLGVIKGLGPARYLEPLPLRPRGPTLLDITPEEVSYWMQVVSRERAMKAYRLLRKGVVGTLPELLTYEWLERWGRIFEFQSSFMGGRLTLGGAVADFVIFDLVPGGLMIWRVQGDHWHTMPERVIKDQAQKERLLREHYMGLPVKEVVDLWESAIYWRAPYVFEAAEVGVEIGRAAER